MTSARAAAMVWTERAIALAIVLQTVELLQLRRVYSESGIWRWSILADEHAALPGYLRATFAALLPDRPFLALLWLRLGCALALLAAGAGCVLPLLWFSQLAICVRFRGAFNGGSDAMTLLITFCASVAWLASYSPVITSGCLAFIAVQATLSYFVAGVAKLKEASWRDGEALRAFVASPQYNTPAWLRRGLSAPALARPLGLGVIAFECVFPLAWTGPTACAALLAIGLGFHVANAWLFGLNRFLFAWAAAYPALAYCSASFSG